MLSYLRSDFVSVSLFCCTFLFLFLNVGIYVPEPHCLASTDILLTILYIIEFVACPKQSVGVDKEFHTFEIL